MNILFVVPYPLQKSPSQRFRFEQYFGILKANGHTYDVKTFLNSENWKMFLKPGNTLRKIRGLASGFTRRAGLIFVAHRYDFIFIHREAAPVGPPVFEWIFATVLKKKIIYDFDDAIWTSDRASESWLLKAVKWRSKISSICSWSYRVSCGNRYLCDYAQRFNGRVQLNPTTIDMTYHMSDHSTRTADNSEIIIGWTGSSSTVKYLNEIEHILRRIEDQFPQVRFHFIADKAPDLKLRRMDFFPWNPNTEISDLQRFHIGIMPLPNDEWSRGKCGFKLLQYFALEIPAVASEVGVNGDIIDQNQSGFLCTTETEWHDALTKLIIDRSKREQFGAVGKKQVEKNYSVESNAANFLSLFA